MPNNRNRNRNRNRNKRNRNQNQTQNQNEQRPEGEAEEEHLPEDTQPASTSSSVDDNGNSGSVSNGPTESTSNNGQNADISDPGVTNSPAEEENREKPSASHHHREGEAEDMGAKNSKQQKEKKAKHDSQVDEQVRPGPTIIRRPPGSPRVAKVIVHRIVRDEDEVDHQAKQEEQPNDRKAEPVQETKEVSGEDVAVAQLESGKKEEVQVPVAQLELEEKEQEQPTEIPLPKEQQPKAQEQLEAQQQQEPKELVHQVQQIQEVNELLEKKQEEQVDEVETHSSGEEKDQHKVEERQESKEEPQVAQKPMEKTVQEAQQVSRIPEIQVPQPNPLQRTSKVIIHQIRLESDEEERARKGKPKIEEISSISGLLGGTLSPPPRYLVESPKNVATGGQFSRFARDVQIQELELTSDCSSGEFNNTLSPVVCEADSETEGSVSGSGSGGALAAGQERSAPDPQLPSSSRVEQQEQLRQKRAQKRNALESHFLPQLMNPRYLDSILEENGETPSFRSSSSSASLDPSSGGQRTPKLNETFPKSQLDFSRRHKRREEAPSPLKLETKFLEQSPDLESCTRLQSALSPQSEDAELVYLSSSASSSVSDLMELELEQAAALAERALVDLDTDASRLINRPDDEMSSTSTTTAERSETETETEAETETETEREAGNQESRESTPVNVNASGDADADATAKSLGNTLPMPTATPTPAAEERADTNVSGGSSASFGAASALAATREEFVRNMDKVRELIEMTRREQEETGTDTETGTKIGGEVTTGSGAGTRSRSPSLSPPPVPPPPAGLQLYCPPPPPVPETSEILHLTSLQLRRQESNDSHCSDSTTHSQCTAINLASPPLPSNQPPTPPLRQKPAPPPPPPAPLAPPSRSPPTTVPVPVSVPQPTPAPANASPPASLSESELSVADSETDAIKKLRLLCTETLASMPYGEQVLEELASVAQNIQTQGKMPYPMPQLPHIKELELNASEGKSSSSSAWLGLPTQSDPQLLVCLSPAQRQLLDEQTQPDQLLDAHQKFVERRGYHEMSKAQVMEQEQSQQQQQQQSQQQQSEMLKTAAMMRELRKSLSPSKSPPPPIPPPPVPVKSAETAAKAKRDDASEPNQNSQHQQKIASGESSSLENKPRRAADPTREQSLAELRQSSTTMSSTSIGTGTGTGKFPTLDSMESELARMFPQHKAGGDIFEEQRKRFSNIEFPSHNAPAASSQTKRYSNIETSSYESKKRTENGQVVYDVSQSSREKKEQGDPPAEKPPQEQPAPPVPPPPIMSATKLNGGTFIDGDNNTPKNSHSESGMGNGTYEEFRQRAKAALDAMAGDQNRNQQQRQQQPQQNGLEQDHVFKDFDRLSQQMHDELQSTRERREKSASLYDLSGLTKNNPGQHKLGEVHQRRHAHMQELEKEIERSARSRQERLSSVSRQMEATAPQVHEIPIELESRSRRAESLCNLREPPPRPHTTVGNYGNQSDDWSRYANDLGYSENIARPFAREVEICYQRQNQNPNQNQSQNPRATHGIRAPRLSASTNDLSSSSQYSFDNFNAYGGRRTHAPMLNQVQQQQRPHYGSCYSMIERDPNPRYISTTSRRGVSPAPTAGPPTPQLPPPAYDRQQRRSSLPRELHEQQLKYILSKEEELKLEVERLQQERRRLMEEMQRAPVLPAPQRRESYRPAAKLPTLSEDEVFRQQMAEEWMNKVAEREERRHNKIIRISKIEDEQEHTSADRATISDEFLDRVKERRHKLAMPADSDWESGAESQPQAQYQSQGESDVEGGGVPVKILEGQAEANLRQLPRHLREFAKFSTSEQLPDGGQVERHEEQERREEASDNAHSSATKKTSIVKTYKVSRLPPSVQDEATESGSESRYNSARSSTVHQIDRQESSSSISSSPAGKFGANLDEFFAGSPFRSKIFEEFDKYWRNFEHSAPNTF